MQGKHEQKHAGYFYITKSSDSYVYERLLRILGWVTIQLLCTYVLNALHCFASAFPCTRSERVWVRFISRWQHVTKVPILSKYFNV